MERKMMLRQGDLPDMDASFKDGKPQMQIHGTGIQSKFIIPELPDKVFVSKRMKGLSIRGNRASMLTAPSGFGKTTLVLLSLQPIRQHTHWYRLEKEDGLLPVFYANLIETLFAGVEKNVLESHRGLSSISNIQEEYAMLNALLCQDAWQYFPDEKTTHYLVFDDFHHVAEHPVIAQTIRYLINNLPHSISVVVLSRSETAICTGNLAWKRSICFVNKEDLCLTREETQKFLADINHVKLASQELDCIHTYVEGWVAALSLIGKKSNAIRFLCDGTAREEYWNEQTPFQMFFGEFLSGVNKNWLLTLAKMAIFTEFSAEELDEILQDSQVHPILEWLTRSNIYIQKINTQPVKYRFHSLFRLELEVYLKKTIPDKEIKTLLAKAAVYYQHCGDMRQAIRCFIRANQAEKAVQVNSESGTAFFARGEPEKIMYLVTEFPEAIVEKDPYLLFYRGLVLRTMDVPQAYLCLRSAMMLFVGNGDMSYLMNTFGLILIMSFESNDFSYVESVVSALPKFKVFFEAAASRIKLLVSGFISAVADEKFHMAMIYRKLINRMKITEPIWNYSYLMLCGMLDYRTGQLEKAYRRMPGILSHPVGAASDQWRFIGLVSCHNTLWLSRDLEASRKIRDEFAALAEKYNSDFFHAFAFRLSAIIKFQTRDIAGAVADMSEVAQAYTRYGSPILASAATITQLLWETEWIPATALVEKAEDAFLNIPKENAGHGYYELCQGMLGAIHKAAENNRRAEELLLSAYRESRRKKAWQHMCAMAMHLADLYARTGNVKSCRKYLRLWAKESQRNAYVFFHEMTFEALVRMCSLAYEQGYATDHMQAMIRLYFGTDKMKQMIFDAARITANPKNFLRVNEIKAPQRAEISVSLFGSFCIKKGEVAIEEREWKTKKISGILAVILAQPHQRISRDRLSTMFWPDSDSKAAYASLRVALYELRKVLDRFDMGFKSECALVEEDKNGFCVGAGLILTTDAQEFQALYDAYKGCHGSESHAEEVLSEIIKLYQGDFLMQQDMEDSWVHASREYYRAMFMEASMALSRIYIKQCAWEKAELILQKHIAIDPLSEKGASLLVEVYQKTGQATRAKSYERQFKKRFVEEMGVLPE